MDFWNFVNNKDIKIVNVLRNDLVAHWYSHCRDMKIKQIYTRNGQASTFAARISLLSFLRSVQRRGVRRRHVETSECLVRGASDCQFIVRIIARNRAALFGGRVTPSRAALCFYNWCIALPIRMTKPLALVYGHRRVFRRGRTRRAAARYALSVNRALQHTIGIRAWCTGRALKLLI